MRLLSLRIRHRVWLAWLLLLTLAPQLVVKTFHYHVSLAPTEVVVACAAAQDASPAKDSKGNALHAAQLSADGHCSICDFTPFFATEPLVAEFGFFAPRYPLHLVPLVEQTVPMTTSVATLRGPPMA